MKLRASCELREVFLDDLRTMRLAMQRSRDDWFQVQDKAAHSRAILQRAIDVVDKFVRLLD